MPIGGERPDPPKGQAKIKKAVNSFLKVKEESKEFFADNWKIFTIFALIILGSNLHEILPVLGIGDKWSVYLFAQQLFGASALYTFIYWLERKRENVFEKSFSLTIFILSLYCVVGEFFNMLGLDFLNQVDKGWRLFSEFAFVVGVTLTGMIFYKKK